jgi:hypothetical protein
MEGMEVKLHALSILPLVGDECKVSRSGPGHRLCGIHGGLFQGPITDCKMLRQLHSVQRINCPSSNREHADCKLSPSCPVWRGKSELLYRGRNPCVTVHSLSWIKIETSQELPGYSVLERWSHPNVTCHETASLHHSCTASEFHANCYHIGKPFG